MPSASGAPKSQRGLNPPRLSVLKLKLFFYRHFDNPYPTDGQKEMLARVGEVSPAQIATWFINARMRLWKPAIDKLFTALKERLRAQDQQPQDPDGVGALKPEHPLTAAGPPYAASPGDLLAVPAQADLQL